MNLFNTDPVRGTAVEQESDYECGNYVNHTRLSCTADGYPDPTFTWTDVDTGDVFNTATITLTRSGNYSLVCTATNDIRGVPYTEQITADVSISAGDALLQNISFLFISISCLLCI